MQAPGGEDGFAARWLPLWLVVGGLSCTVDKCRFELIYFNILYFFSLALRYRLRAVAELGVDGERSTLVVVIPHSSCSGLSAATVATDPRSK